jgi:hypothetical protein
MLLAGYDVVDRGSGEKKEGGVNDQSPPRRDLRGCFGNPSFRNGEPPGAEGKTSFGSGDTPEGHCAHRPEPDAGSCGGTAGRYGHLRRRRAVIVGMVRGGSKAGQPTGLIL